MLSAGFVPQVAALELYSMLRDEWVTARDTAACSAYTQLSNGLLPPKVRDLSCAGEPHSGRS